MILNFKINKPIESVIKHFENVENFASIHPIIIGYEPEIDGYYKITESIFPFTPKVKYLIKIFDSKDNSIKMEAFLFNRRICIADIQLTFTFESDKINKNVTYVREEVNFYTFAPFKPVFGLIFKYFHKKMFRNINEL